MIVANFMDSSLQDLRAKGVFATVPALYNPGGAFQRVIHFTPHARDLELADDLRRSGIELISHQVTGVQPLKFAKTLARVWRILRREHVDIVRGRLPYLGSLLGALAARARRIPFVVSLGGDNRIVQERNRSYYYNSRALSYGIEWTVLRLADRIIVPNRFTAAYVERILGAAAALRRCVVIPWMAAPVPPADPADDGRLAALGIPAHAALVPVIGFLNRYKYADVVLDALDGKPLVAADGRPALFCFAGDGPLRAEAEKRFSGRVDVRFLGWQPHEMVQALLRRAELVLIPMSGFVLLEAASLGKAVISSAVEWHGELVEDGRTGYLIDPHESRNWRDAIDRALLRPDEARAMGAQLAAVYRAHFSVEKSIVAELALYEDLTGKRASA